MQAKFRNKRFEIFDRLLREILKTQTEVTILDTGGRPDYWEKLASDLRPKVKVTCINFQGELDEYPKVSEDLNVVSVVGDACEMPEYSNKFFDVVHSNSVIEHVGSYKNMERFAKEARRIGVTYYIQTPNFWFPIEPHYGVPFFHWLPDTWRIWLFTNFHVGYAHKCSFENALIRVDHTRIISKSMMRNLFPEAEIKIERFFGFPKSIIAISATKVRPH